MKGLRYGQIFSFLRKPEKNIKHATYEHAPSLSAPHGLLCELLGEAEQPVHIKTHQPRFSWIVGDNSAGAVQSAYQILVADSREKIQSETGNLWNSGKVAGACSVHVPYRGKRLRQGGTYYWKVRTWNGDGAVSHFSTPCSFCIDQEKGVSHYALVKKQVPPVFLSRKEGDTVFMDFGKAAFGTLSLRLHSDTAGRLISVHLGEVLEKPQHIHRQPGGARRYRRIELPLQKGTHTYILEIPADARNTRKKAIKMPGYAGEVVPFRYCEITGYSGEISPQDVRQLMVNYPFDDASSSFHSSEQVLNKVWELCKYTIKASSFAGIYVDGDRERVPYESDAYINQLGHYATDREFSMARRSIAYLLTHATWPTEWILHAVLLAYADYLHTGDLSLVRQYYRLLKKKTLMALARPDGLISTRTGKATRRLERALKYDARMFKGKPLKDIVDWPHPGSLGLSEQDPGETDGFEFCTYNTVVNAFHYRALLLMGRMAEGLGKHRDAGFFSNRAGRVLHAFNSVFLDRSKGIYVDGEGSGHSALHANMFPLAFGMVPEAYKPKVVSFIKSRGMACSVYGAQYLLEALYQAGEDEYAAALLTSTGERSWAHMMEAGSTMTMEAWDDRFKPNQDWNHAWGAAPANILPRYLMGVRPLEPGFGRLLIQPQPGPIQSGSLKLPTIRGSVEVAFQRTAESFALELKLPANTSAQLALPYADSSSAQPNLNGQIVPFRREGKYVIIDHVGAGAHSVLLTCG